MQKHMKNIIHKFSPKGVSPVRIKWLKDSSKLLPCRVGSFSPPTVTLSPQVKPSVSYTERKPCFLPPNNNVFMQFSVKPRNIHFSAVHPILSGKKLQTETDSGVGYSTSTRIYQTNEESSHSYDMDNPTISIYI